MIYYNLTPLNNLDKKTIASSLGYLLTNKTLCYENDEVILFIDKEKQLMVLNKDKDITDNRYRKHYCFISLNDEREGALCYSVYEIGQPKKKVHFEISTPVSEDQLILKESIHDAIVHMQQRKKEERKQIFKPSCISAVIITLLFGLFLMIYSHITATPILIACIQWGPIYLALLSVVLFFILFKYNILNRYVLFHTALFATLIVIPKLFINLGINARGIWVTGTFMAIFIFYCLFISIAIIPFVKKKNRMNNKKYQVNRNTAVFIVLLIPLLIVNLIFSIQNTNVAPTAYYTFSYSEFSFYLGVALITILTLPLSASKKMIRSIFIVMTVLFAFSLSYSTSLNVSLAYKFIDEKQKSYQSIEKIESVWTGTFEGGIERVDTEGVDGSNDRYIDGLKLLSPFNEKIEHVAKIDDTTYQIKFKHFDKYTEQYMYSAKEIWKKVEKRNELKYIHPVMQDSNPFIEKQISKSAVRILEDNTESYIFTKKQGSKTVIVQECPYYTRTGTASILCLYQIDDNGDVVTGGLYYSSKQTQQTNKITGYYYNKNDERVVYQFNDDGSYTIMKNENQTTNGNEYTIDKLLCQNTNTENLNFEELANLSNEERIRKAQKSCQYEKRGDVHIIRNSDSQAFIFNGDKYLVGYNIRMDNEGFYGSKRYYSSLKYEKYDYNLNQVNNFNELEFTDTFFYDGSWYFYNINDTEIPNNKYYAIYDNKGERVELS